MFRKQVTHIQQCDRRRVLRPQLWPYDKATNKVQKGPHALYSAGHQSALLTREMHGMTKMESQERLRSLAAWICCGGEQWWAYTPGGRGLSLEDCLRERRTIQRAADLGFIPRAYD